MTHYTLATSPFGNFAVQRRDVGADRRELESYVLTPIGNLDAVPLKTGHGNNNALWLDHDALEAEARRQLTERGTAPHPFFAPRPLYVVNRAIYTDDLRATLYRAYPQSEDPTPYWSVNTGRFDQGLTDSAQAKLTAWWEGARDSIVTPEFLARDAVDRADYAMHRAFRDWTAAHDAADTAQTAHDAAITAWHAATDALAAL